MLSSIDADFEISPLNIYFSLDVNEARLAAFSGLSGGEVEVAQIKHNVVYSSGELRTLMIPGPAQYSPVTLERGYGNTKELYNWFVKATTGQIFSARTNATVTLNGFMEDAFTPLVSWNLINAWPIKISGFESDQSSSPQVAKFSITLAVEGIERIDP